MHSITLRCTTYIAHWFCDINCTAWYNWMHICIISKYIKNWILASTFLFLRVINCSPRSQMNIKYYKKSKRKINIKLNVNASTKRSLPSKCLAMYWSRFSKSVANVWWSHHTTSWLDRLFLLWRRHVVYLLHYADSDIACVPENRYSRAGWQGLWEWSRWDLCRGVWENDLVGDLSLCSRQPLAVPHAMLSLPPVMKRTL